MPNTAEIHVRGLRDLDRALKAVSKDAQKGLRDELKAAAEPVRAGAEQRAHMEIRNIGDRWSQMRTRATSKVTYVQPQARRRQGSPRGNLAGLLMDRAMQPALDAAQPGLEAGVERMIDNVADRNGF